MKHSHQSHSRVMLKLYASYNNAVVISTLTSLPCTIQFKILTREKKKKRNSRTITTASQEKNKPNNEQI